MESSAQRLYDGPPTSDGGKLPIRWAQKSDFDGSILFCRGVYTSDRIEANGAGWITDHPGGDHNFLVRLSQLTEVRVRFAEVDRIPFYVAIGLGDPLLAQCPILFMEDVGTLALEDGEVENLRHYLEAGGFLWVDDFWGTRAWDQFEQQIRLVLPSGLYPMVDIPPDHQILHQLYDAEVVQIPNVGLFRETLGLVTSERGTDSQEVHFRGIQDERGRLMVVATHNTDITDALEEEARFGPFQGLFSAKAYALAINIWLYALTH